MSKSNFSKAHTFEHETHIQDRQQIIKLLLFPNIPQSVLASQEAGQTALSQLHSEFIVKQVFPFFLLEIFKVISLHLTFDLTFDPSPILSSLMDSLLYLVQKCWSGQISWQTCTSPLLTSALNKETKLLWAAMIRLSVHPLFTTF